MSQPNQHIIGALTAARQRKGLSQRTLSGQAGLPQSHLSRIENGRVDLKLSSLTELARLLDSEVMLIPRQLIPAVVAIIRQSHGPAEADSDVPAYRLGDDDD